MVLRERYLLQRTTLSDVRFNFCDFNLCVDPNLCDEHDFFKRFEKLDI